MSTPSALVTVPETVAPSLARTCSRAAPRSPVTTPVRPVSVTVVEFFDSAWPVQTPFTSAPMHTRPDEDDRSMDSGAPPMSAAAMPRSATLASLRSRRASSSPVWMVPLEGCVPLAVSVISPLARTPRSTSLSPLMRTSRSAAVAPLPPAARSPVAVTPPGPAVTSRSPSRAVDAPSVTVGAAMDTLPVLASMASIVTVCAPACGSPPAVTQTEAPLQTSVVARTTTPPAFNAPRRTDPPAASMSM